MHFTCRIMTIISSMDGNSLGGSLFISQGSNWIHVMIKADDAET